MCVYVCVYVCVCLYEGRAHYQIGDGMQQGGNTQRMCVNWLAKLVRRDSHTRSHTAEASAFHRRASIAELQTQLGDALLFTGHFRTLACEIFVQSIKKFTLYRISIYWSIYMCYSSILWTNKNKLNE